MNKAKRDWYNMALDTHRNAKGKCEVCGKNLPLGTAPAHIIPRKKSDPSLDEEWNLALLGYVNYNGCTCHTQLDDNRGKFYQGMEGCRLLQRIQNNPRLKEYFDKRLAIWEVKQEQKGRF